MPLQTWLWSTALPCLEDKGSESGLEFFTVLIISTLRFMVQGADSGIDVQLRPNAADGFGYFVAMHGFMAP